MVKGWSRDLCSYSESNRGVRDSYLLEINAGSASSAPNSYKAAVLNTKELAFEIDREINFSTEKLVDFDMTRVTSNFIRTNNCQRPEASLREEITSVNPSGNNYTVFKIEPYSLELKNYVKVGENSGADASFERNQQSSQYWKREFDYLYGLDDRNDDSDSICPICESCENGGSVTPFTVLLKN